MGNSAIRKAGVTKAMTPIAERQRRVERVRDSSVGGMCWRERPGESIKKILAR